jgi:superoxide dismutase, Cu-Zn family
VHAAISVAVCVLVLIGAAAQVDAPGASAEVRDAAGQLWAMAQFRERQGEVFITLNVVPGASLIGTRAIHIHERGRCDAPDFTTAGGIFNPFSKQHGLLNPDGPMVGDLPDLVLGERGLATYNLSAPLATLQTGPASLLRPGGTALVVSARGDDNVSQPDGNSGQRLACGVIVAPGQTAPIPDRADNASPVPPLLVGGLGVVLLVAGFVLRRL